MNLIAGRRMMEGDQVRGFAEALDRDGKAHVDEYPTDDRRKNPKDSLNPRM
jgi:hypothetical protein